MGEQVNAGSMVGQAERTLHWVSEISRTCDYDVHGIASEDTNGDVCIAMAARVCRSPRGRAFLIINLQTHTSGIEQHINIHTR